MSKLPISELFTCGEAEQVYKWYDSLAKKIFTFALNLLLTKTIIISPISSNNDEFRFGLRGHLEAKPASKNVQWKLKWFFRSKISN